MVPEIGPDLESMNLNKLENAMKVITIFYTNLNNFQGGWLNDNQNGNGMFTWSNGDYYIGQWENDNRHGCGRFVFASLQKEKIGVYKFNCLY